MGDNTYALPSITKMQKYIFLREKIGSIKKKLSKFKVSVFIHKVAPISMNSPLGTWNSSDKWYQYSVPVSKKKNGAYILT